jgi:hypothetical protein
MVGSSAPVGKIFLPTALGASEDISFINHFCVGIAIAFALRAEDTGYP